MRASLGARPPCCALGAPGTSGRDVGGCVATASPRRAADASPPARAWRPRSLPSRGSWRGAAPPRAAPPRSGTAAPADGTLAPRAREVEDAASAGIPPFLPPSDDAPDDFYSLLELDPSASGAEVKEAYRRLQKACHPDIAGDEATECSVLLNEAFAVLSDPASRRSYDLGLAAARLFFSGEAGEDGLRPYTGQSFSEWRGEDPRASSRDAARAVFVDEGTCIGCKNCTHCAPATFAMEPEWGRARVMAQWADTERDIQTAISSCPVDCIHFVGARSLPVLEFVMQGAKRVGTGHAAGGGVRAADPFELAAIFIRKGREREAAAAVGTGDAGAAAAAGRLQGRVRGAWLKLRADVRAQWRKYAAAARDA